LKRYFERAVLFDALLLADMLRLGRLKSLVVMIAVIFIGAATLRLLSAPRVAVPTGKIPMT
jgi:hypothetical protein